MVGGWSKGYEVVVVVVVVVVMVGWWWWWGSESGPVIKGETTTVFMVTR